MIAGGHRARVRTPSPKLTFKLAHRRVGRAGLEPMVRLLVRRSLGSARTAQIVLGLGYSFALATRTF